MLKISCSDICGPRSLQEKIRLGPTMLEGESHVVIILLFTNSHWQLLGEDNLRDCQKSIKMCIFKKFFISFTFVLLVSLFVGFVLHPLSDSLLFTNFIICCSSQYSWKLYLYLIYFCPIPGPVPDSAFYLFFFCVHFTPD